MKPTITVTGIDDAVDLLERIAPNQARNIMRATVHDMAKEIRDDTRKEMPDDEGVMKAETKHKRERAIHGKLQSTVRVGRKAFYWRFLEYGTGPDRIAHDFFLKAVHGMRAEMTPRFLLAFGRKFEAALARARNRQ